MSANSERKVSLLQNSIELIKLKGSTFVPVILKYNQSLESFYDATYRGRVSLQSKKGMNYYFTPLGKSYVCVEDEDPITLFNTDDEPSNLTIANSLLHIFQKNLN